jgi:hypothetical protein
MLADSKAIAAPEAPCKCTNAANDPATTEIQSVASPARSKGLPPP